MKKLSLLLILIIIVELVSASSIFLRDIIYEGKTKIYKTDNGMYVLELVIVSDSTRTAKFRLNDEYSDTLKAGDNYRFNDGSEIIVNSVIPNEASEGLDEVNIYFFGSGKNLIPLVKSEEFNISSIDTASCNFDSKCINETQEECCSDCGCKFGFRCIDNKCIEAEECSKNIDCNDDKACTKDECTDKNCFHTDLEGCELNNSCFNYGYATNESYCSNDGWQKKKKIKEFCNNDYECLTNLCKKNICINNKSFSKIFAFVLLIILLTLSIIVIIINRKGIKIFKRKQKIKFKF